MRERVRGSEAERERAKQRIATPNAHPTGASSQATINIMQIILSAPVSPRLQVLRPESGWMA